MLRTREHLRRMIALQSACPRDATLNPQDCVYLALVSRATVSADACPNTADNFMGVGTTLLVTETLCTMYVCYLI